MDESNVQDGWEVWHSEENGRMVLVFRPDIFDGNAYPPACIPTINVRRDRDPRQPTTASWQSNWEVTMQLEPTVTVCLESVDSQPAAVETARQLAQSFSDGEIDYQSAYQRPREAYLEALDELVSK